MWFSNPLLGALVIFVIRTLSVAVSTIRVLIMGRANKLAVAFLAAIEALAFAITFGQVAQDLNNPWNLSSYCLGFAAGTWVGTLIEERVVRGYATITIVSKGRSLPIVEAIRKAGFGATRSSGEGAEGSVGLVRVVALRKEVPAIIKLAQDIDSSAFVTIEETRGVRRGYIGFGRI